MVERLLASMWALEPRFHNVQAALMLRKMERGMSAMDVEDHRQEPYLAQPSAGWTDANNRTHYGWNVTSQKSGKVAIIPIIGAMSRYGDLCSYGTEDIANWILEANQLPEISAIVLEINSPGGEVDGTELLGAVVKQSAKPVVSYVAGMAASAAYWVASQSREIVMESTAASQVGSIGVLSMHVDASAFYEMKGWKVTIIRSEGSEDKALFNSVEPLTSELIDATRAEMKPIREAFVKTVKSGRPNLAQDDRIFRGQMFNGKEAIKLGMADRIGYLGDAIARADLLARQQAA